MEGKQYEIVAKIVGSSLNRQGQLMGYRLVDTLGKTRDCTLEEIIRLKNNIVNATFDSKGEVDLKGVNNELLPIFTEAFIKQWNNTYMVIKKINDIYVLCHITKARWISDRSVERLSFDEIKQAVSTGKICLGNAYIDKNIIKYSDVNVLLLERGYNGTVLYTVMNYYGVIECRELRQLDINSKFLYHKFVLKKNAKGNNVIDYIVRKDIGYLENKIDSTEYLKFSVHSYAKLYGIGKCIKEGNGYNVYMSTDDEIVYTIIAYRLADVDITVDSAKAIEFIFTCYGYEIGPTMKNGSFAIPQQAGSVRFNKSLKINIKNKQENNVSELRFNDGFCHRKFLNSDSVTRVKYFKNITINGGANSNYRLFVGKNALEDCNIYTNSNITIAAVAEHGLDSSNLCVIGGSGSYNFDKNSRLGEYALARLNRGNAKYRYKHTKRAVVNDKFTIKKLVLTNGGAQHAFNNANIKALAIDRNIKYSEFRHTEITAIKFGNNVRDIAERAFQECKVKEVTIPAGAVVHKRAFADCNELTTVRISDNAVIGDGAFLYCKNLREFYIGKGVVLSGMLKNKENCKIVINDDGSITEEKLS